MSTTYDAVVIGAGPNGLAAAITLARAGLKVLLREAGSTVGGAMRSAELTLPGFVHDVGAAVMALPQASPFFRSVPIHEHGVVYDFPPVAFGHPLDDGRAALCGGSVDETARRLGADDDAYRRLIGPIVEKFDDLVGMILGPPLRVPKHPLTLARFGLKAIRSARGLADANFHTDAARALFAGAASHAVLPFDFVGSAAYGLVLMASAHAGRWPVARGGSQAMADALASYFRSLGGTIQTGAAVTTLGELDALNCRAILCDIGPRQFLALGGDRLPTGYARTLKRFRYGPAAFKMDWALHAPVPWKNPALTQAGTIHLGGTLDEMAHAEHEAWNGRSCRRPYTLAVQASLFDPTRAPPGKHTLWAYAHVPHGSTEDFTEAVEDQIERFAPGFRDCIAARSVLKPADLEAFDANLVGGDITGGAQIITQAFTRPAVRIDPYSTPIKGVYLCSASTPPGGGVHGMCGFNAATSALAREFKIRTRRSTNLHE